MAKIEPENHSFKGAVRKQAVFAPGWNSPGSKAKRILKQFYFLLVHSRYIWGIRKRTCNICEQPGCFYAYGSPPRYDALCSNCGSLERHRLLHLWLKRNENLWQGKRVIHFAPEHFLRSYVERASAEYLAADFVASQNCMQIDIENISVSNNSFDIVICSHVIEHVNDAKALSEIRRVLTKGGIALIMAPTIDGWDKTYENESISSPIDRKVHFGQDDHVRYYGTDLLSRIELAKFEVNTFVAVEPDVHIYGLQRGDKVFISTAI